MKRLVLAITIVLGFTSQVFSQGTPRGMQIAQGVLGVANGFVMGAAGVENSAACSAEPVGVYQCAKGIAEITGSGASLYLAEESVRNADEMDGSGSVSAPGPMPTRNNTNDGGIDLNNLFPCGMTDPLCEGNKGNNNNGDVTTTQNNGNTLDTVDANKLLNIINEKKAFVQSGLDKAEAALASKGMSSKDLLENPEKYMSAEEAQKLKSEIDNSAPDMLGKDAQAELDKLLTEDSSSESYESSEFRTVASEGGVFANLPELPKFDLDSLFASQLKEGKENSAPGYYGNVPLSVLNPSSKKSLFERVSLKLKKLM